MDAPAEEPAAEPVEAAAESPAEEAEPSTEADAETQGEAPQPETQVAPQMLAANEPAVLSGEVRLTNQNISTYVNRDLSDGTYILSENITVASDSLRVTGAATLDLNGYTLTFTAPAETKVLAENGDNQYSLNAGIVVYGNLKLTDSSESHSGKLDVPGMGNIGVLVAPSANFTMTGGTITNSTTGDNHGIGLAVLGATASMTGGKITGEKGFGVWAAASSHIPSSFTMDGDAVISDCGAGVNSRLTTGGILIASYCTLTIKGGTITNCASYYGGGVYFGGNTFTMSGGSITNCKAGYGGGVYMAGRTFELSGGTISGCESNGGGGIYTDTPDATITMSNGSITGCSAPNGGGVYLESSSGTFTMDGGSITNCKATEEGMGYGGGVLLTHGCFTMNGGEISGCTANEGSSILAYGLSTASDVTLNDGTVAGSVVLSYKLNSGTCRMEGLGTQTYPYQIEDVNQLLVFQSIVNGTYSSTQAANPAACAEVTKNLEMRGVTGFSPIGTKDHPYTGTFVGDYEHKGGTDHPANIHELKIDSSSDAVGLFGYVDGAKIQNIKLWDSKITVTHSYAGRAGSYAGGIVGYAKGAAKIENCSTDNITITADSRHIGGIIGRGEGSTEISNCTNTSTLTGKYHVGGIAGSLFESSITSCGNRGNLPATESRTCVGGIVGILHAGQISTCYNTGEVVGGSDADIGGILGLSESSPSISDCYNVGAVRGGESTGGIAGFAIGTFRYCYNTGAVTDSQRLGGIIGDNSGIKIDHCYYLDTSASEGISQDNDQSGVEARTAAEFADGTVLKALIAGRGDGQHPWNQSCQYLNVTRKTQPVFKQQGDPHKHIGGAWQYDETSHWRVCDCNVVVEKAAHTAAADDGDCTTEVLCEVCGATVTAANTAHTWDVWTSNGDGTHTRRCTAPGCTVGVETEKCTDANHDYTCDRCGAALARPAAAQPAAAQHTAHSGGVATCNARARCTACGVEYGGLDPANHTDLQHSRARAATETTEGNIEYWYCTGCAKYFTDAAGTKEIAKAATRQPKLSQPTNAAVRAAIPATGDADAPVLWRVLFLFSGSALLAMGTTHKRRGH